ncbi:hypothetical protein GPECTOR_158g102 [Gonium pectorale]|uniref:Uncharacterized protein n=1 Tax=Gonium pectorale TaxID=33097 RepID=A0A150FXN5_GONPE|nr:hypothetical protein GPECTOR_158g102 [Gonium pectorale]|eukprot:KXZ42348.1 hypothetical protein GPECTOR_158g102 [Gonium pectorale]
MMMLEQSADPDVEDQDGATPLQLTKPAGATRDAFSKYLFLKVIVSLYVIFLVLFKEALFARRFYSYSSELLTVLEDHSAKRTAAMFIVGTTTLFYTGVFALVQFVTLVLISEASDPPSVILNGVGAIFILEFDETIARVFVPHYQGAVYGAMLKKLLHPKRKESNESGKAPSEAGAAKTASPGDPAEAAPDEGAAAKGAAQEPNASGAVMQLHRCFKKFLALVRSSTFGDALYVIAWLWCSAISLYHLISL